MDWASWTAAAAAPNAAGVRPEESTALRRALRGRGAGAACNQAWGRAARTVSAIADARQSLRRLCSSAFEKYGGRAHGSSLGTSSGWKEKARMRVISSRSTQAAASVGRMRWAYITPALARGRSGWITSW